MKTFIASFILAFSINTFAAATKTLLVKFTNLGPEGGQIAVAVFADPSAFPDQGNKAIFSKFFPLERGVKETSLKLELPVGNYALTTFQDKNSNKKLDKNMLGAPTERFGFSRNPKIGFSAPNFAECAFEVTEQKEQTLSIGMKKLF